MIFGVQMTSIFSRWPPVSIQSCIASNGFNLLTVGDCVAGTFTIWDTETAQPIMTVDPGHGIGGCVMANPMMPNVFASSGMDGTIKM